VGGQRWLPAISACLWRPAAHQVGTHLARYSHCWAPTDRLTSVSREHSPLALQSCQDAHGSTPNRWRYLKGLRPKYGSKTIPLTTCPYTEPNAIAVMPSDTTTEHPLCIGWKPRLHASKDGHDGPINTIGLSPDGNLVATGSSDETIKIWSSTTGSCLRTLHDDGAVHAVSFSTDGQLLVSGSLDLKTWEVETGRCLRVLSGHEGSVRAIATTAARPGRLISYSFDRTIKFWALKESCCLGTLDTKSFACSAAFSADGSRLALGLDDGSIRVWDLHTERVCTTLRGHQNSAKVVTFSPSNRSLASYSFDRTIRVWNVSLGVCFRIFRAQDMVCSLAFSPDSRLLALGRDFEGFVEVWDQATGRRKQILDGHNGPVTSVAFTADGERVVTGSFDSTIQVWHLVENGHRAAERCHDRACSLVCICPA